MALGQQLFPFRREPGINFNWTDVNAATGYVEYDLTEIAVASVSTPIILPTSLKGILEGAVQAQAGSGTETDYTKEVDRDHDLEPFKLPTTIEGRAILRIGFSLENTTGTGTANAYAIIKIKKNDVVIASGQSSNLQVPTATTTVRVNNLGIDLPKTRFQKGDFLRITVEIWAKDTVGDQYHVGFAYNVDDEAFGDYGAGESRFPVIIPYKIDL